MYVLILLLLSLLLYSHLLSLSSANSITLSLYRVAPPTTNPLENIKYHAAASLARAHRIKYTNIHTPLYPRSYGLYFVALSFGTPPQTLSFILDTGSSPVWFPCTNNYTCTNCPARIPTFIPKSSSSYKNVTCKSSQCKLLFPNLQCNNRTLCGYIVKYGTGNTTGRILSETLTFPGLSVDNFIVGCSISTFQVPEGIVGFGRNPVSLPYQMGLTSFSYCMVSHDLDDNTTASSDLVLTTTRGGGKGPVAKTQYTPFVSNSAFPDFYYVSLQNICIGGVDVKVPTKYLVPDAKGNGGTIVDSGTTLTLMGAPMFDLVFKEVEKQVGKRYERAKKIESKTSLEPCYKVPVGEKKIKLPQFTFHFQENVEMVLPLANYFTYVEKLSVVCMIIMNYGEVERGPTIVLGNYLQQDYYMEYDLKNNRLGIRQKKCK